MQALEREVSQLKGEVVDQQELLSTIAQDKAALSRYSNPHLAILFPCTTTTSSSSSSSSCTLNAPMLLRAVAQNKELKEQLAELQEAFVKQTHRNMGLATSLETEQIRNQRHEQKLTELEHELRQEGQRHAEECGILHQSLQVGVEQLLSCQLSCSTDSLTNVSCQEMTWQCDGLHREKDDLLERIHILHTPPNSQGRSGQEDTGRLHDSIAVWVEQQLLSC